MNATILFESGDAGKVLKLSAVRVRQLAAAGILRVAFRTPRGGYLFAPETIRSFAQQRARIASERSVSVEGIRRTLLDCGDAVPLGAAVGGEA